MKKWIVIETNCYEVETKTKKEAEEIIRNIGLKPYNTEIEVKEKANR